MRIVTHNGKIHSDEVSAVALLSSYFSNKNVEVSVLRTRNSEKFLEGDYLVDVGGEYDHERNRYDHHQAGFGETWDGFQTPLSSAGLIWRHFGKDIVEMYLSNLSNNFEQYDQGFNYSETTIQELVNTIYEKLIYDIDANDNGISTIPGQASLNISEIVSAINGNVTDEISQNTNFNRAVSLVGNIFDIKFREIINGYFNFQKDLENVSTLDLTREYLILENNIPTIFKCLEKLDPENIVKFCIFSDSNRGEYTVKARRTKGEKYSPICPILSEEFLKSCVTNPEHIIFIHRASFIAKTTSLSTAEEIVQRSLEFSKIPSLENLNEDIEDESDDTIENSVQNSAGETERQEKQGEFLNNRLFGCLALTGILGLGVFTYFKFSKTD
jgi:uncharacterized UPF0160 family protein